MEDLPYKFNRDNDGMFYEVYNKPYETTRFIEHKDIKGNTLYLPSHKCFAVQYKKIIISENLEMRYYYRFDTNPKVEHQWCYYKRTTKKVKPKKEDKQYIMLQHHDAVTKLEDLRGFPFEVVLKFKGKKQHNYKYIKSILEKGTL